MSSEDLDEGDLEGRNLSVHEDTSKIELKKQRKGRSEKVEDAERLSENASTNLDLETDVDVGSVDRRTPPEGESTIRNLVETGSLSVGDWREEQGSEHRQLELAVFDARKDENSRFLNFIESSKPEACEKMKQGRSAQAKRSLGTRGERTFSQKRPSQVGLQGNDEKRRRKSAPASRSGQAERRGISQVGSFEQRVLENSLDSSERGDNVDSVVVELPELSIMSLRCPPEGVVLEKLVLLPVGSDSPSLRETETRGKVSERGGKLRFELGSTYLIVSQRVSILLEQGVDSRNSSIPAEKKTRRK